MHAICIVELNVCKYMYIGFANKHPSLIVHDDIPNSVMQHQPAYVVRIWELRNDYVIGAEDIYSFVGHVVTSIFLSLFTGLLFTKCHILVCNNA